MSQRFIKYIPSEKAKWLRKHHLKAFLVLTTIAENARRFDDEETGLKAGDAIVGNFEDMGLNRKEYRNAIDKLVELKMIEIVWNEKNTNFQKRAIKRAIKSEVVCLINSEIYDINIKFEGQQKGQLIEEIEKNEKEGPTKGPTVLREETEQKGPTKGPQTKNEENVPFVKKENEKEKSSVVVVSFPDLKNREKLNSYQAYCEYHSLQIVPHVLERWLLKYSEEVIVHQLGILSSKKHLTRNHEAWMEKVLWEVTNANLNRSFVEEIKHKWPAMTIRKNYCRDEETGNDYQYKLPHEDFVRILETKLESKETERFVPIR